MQRLADRGDKIVQTLPSARAAAHELCQDLGEFLSRRYPHIYKVERSQKNTLGWDAMGSIVKIGMPALGASYDLAKEDALTVAGLIQPADINILVPGDDQYYHLVAMMLGIGGGQRLKDKLGNDLADLHFGGHVPHYAEQLQRPLDRFLSKLNLDGPIQRNSKSLIKQLSNSLLTLIATGISTHGNTQTPYIAITKCILTSNQMNITGRKSAWALKMTGIPSFVGRALVLPAMASGSPQAP